MNKASLPPEDRAPFASGDDDVSELAEIEQRLKMAKPRPVKLDVDAIVRQAGAQDSAPVQSEQLARAPIRRSSGWLGTIAGVWACGAVAGALAMYVLLDRSPVTKTPSRPSLVQDIGVPNSSAHANHQEQGDDASPPRRRVSPPDGPPAWSPAEMLVSTQLLDPYLGAATPLDDGQSPLSAGTILQSLTGEHRLGSHRSTNTTTRDWSNSPDSNDDLPEATGADCGAAQPLTREQWLHELLGNNPMDNVL